MLGLPIALAEAVAHYELLYHHGLFSVDLASSYATTKSGPTVVQQTSRVSRCGAATSPTAAALASEAKLAAHSSQAQHCEHWPQPKTTMTFI